MDLNATQDQIGTVLIAFPILLALCGFLLKWMLNSSTNEIRSIAQEVRIVVGTVNGHTTTLAVQDTRIARLEMENAQLRDKLHDMGNFLQASGLGFTTRGGTHGT